MDDNIEEVDYKGFKIEIVQDEYAPDPREDNNLGIMYCSHPEYLLGDNHDLTPIGITERIEEDDVVIALPLYILDHSGLWMRTSTFREDYGSWDTSMVGYIVATREKIKEWYKVERITKELKERVREELMQEVSTYSSYLSGDVYSIEVPEIDEIYSGYYGYSESYPIMMKEAKALINMYIHRKIEERIKYLKGVIRNRVPLVYRKPFILV